jgi:hypothetical protein
MIAMTTTPTGPGGQTSDGDEPENGGPYDPRAWITDADGTRRPVRRAATQGLDEFAAAWGHNVSEPESLTFDAWQLADDEHPPGSGQVGYRVVHKTVRTIVYPAVEIAGPNLRVRMANGSINSGEPRFVDTLPERSPGYFLKPEWGEVKESPAGEIGYQAQPDMQIHIDNSEINTPPGNYVEVLYAVPDGVAADFSSVLSAGRAGVAPLVVALELQYGTRLLGPVVTEEVEDLFEDGHWNRRLGGRHIRLESQANMQLIHAQAAVGFLSDVLQGQVDRTEEQRRRTRVASQWYLRGSSKPDLTLSYIAYWLVLEALELEENANIAPLKTAVARLLQVEPRSIAKQLGRLYAMRNKLVHGSIGTVSQEQVNDVRSIAVALLEWHSLTRISSSNRSGLAKALGTAPAEEDTTARRVQPR